MNFIKVNKLINRIREAGYEAYVVGGCVRDTLRNVEPHDIDVVTSATPEEVKKVFPDLQTIDTGIKFGTITVIYDDEQFEVTTYRMEGRYSDSRHPDEVEFVTDIKDDLSRRDFTINAMAMTIDDESKITELIDPFNGKADICRRLIRCAGNANERFKEDPLRMLRAIRFAAKLHFNIEDAAYDAICNNAKLLSTVSAERITKELKEMIYYDTESLNTLFKTGLLETFLPELSDCAKQSQKNRWHYADVFHHTLDAVRYTNKFKKLPKDKLIAVRLALMLHDIGKPACVTTDEEGWEHFYGHPEVSYKLSLDILHRLKFSNDEIKLISKLVRRHDEVMTPSNKMLLKIISEYEYDYDDLQLLGYIRESDIMAHIKRENDDRMQRYFKVLKMYRERKESGAIMTINELAINGKDIMNILNINSGEIIGKIKEDLYQLCFYNPAMNNRDTLTDFLINHPNRYINEEE